MRYSVLQNGKAAYIQLYEQLRKDIVEGVYPYGTRLPSKRILAEETGVSVITVQHTYAILCDEGYIESRQRSGYFVIYRQNEFITTEKKAEEQYHITAQQQEKSEFPFSVLSKTMRRVLADYGERILMRSPNQGCIELRAAISAYLTRSTGITVHPEQIIIGAGAEYLYSLAVQLVGKGSKFALEDPSYEKIRQVYTANGVECDMLKMGPDGIQTTELECTDATV
ncbi:MAG: aminotransferase class I/II-fold pyridoxal phosphate-dependent enzyme, partial [Oscillospiraceae bacterium]|nr:aminotransferase class I/II-fold pyridoxal phosphate-dependent enzyme [Oscillospiraceae bacterium]